MEDSRFVIAGTTGRLYASGQGQTSAGARPYDRSSPVFDLDLTNATLSVGADGSWTVIGPSLATGDYVFGPSYSADAGPERTPNTFGSFGFQLAAGTEADPGPGDDGGDGTPSPARTLRAPSAGRRRSGQPGSAAAAHGRWLSGSRGGWARG